MSGPTLLQEGSLIATKQSQSQDALDKIKPIDYIMGWFEKRLHSADSVADRILIVKASTGSGKTTIIPPELYKRFHSQIRRNIACTQPRVINAIQIPNTIVEFNPNLVLGENIGYQTGNLTKKPSRGIIFMTVGLLLQQLNIMADEDFIRKYSVIVVDEAHELSISTEIVLMLMKNLIQRNYKKPECPFLVIMSATFDPDHFANYLLSALPNTKRNQLENIINVRGFTYPITDIPLSIDSTDYTADVTKLVKKIHTENQDDFTDGNNFRDILVFVSGVSQIKKITSSVTSALGEIKDYNTKYPLLIIPLTGDTVKAQSAEYRSIFANYSAKFKRRLIIGTNVAETGITIDTLKYVIDLGFHNSKEYNPDLRAEFLYYKPISDDMRMQRRGRVGRKHPGICYTLYTSDTISAMNPQSFPELYKSDISVELLILLDKTVETGGIDLLSPMPAQLLEHTYEKLWILGMINPDRSITDLGKIAKRFRFIPIESIKMILSGIAWEHNILDLIDIAAVAETVSIRDRDREDVVRKIYTALTDDSNSGHTGLYYQTKHACDFVMMFHLFRLVQKQIITGVSPDKMSAFLENIGLSVTEIREALKLRDELIYIVRSIGIDIKTGHRLRLGTDPELTKRCIYEGYKFNMLYQGKTYNDIQVELPSPFLRNQNYVLYKKLVFQRMPTGDMVPTVTYPSVFDGIPIDYRLNC